jgi:hypothetical protein
MQMTADQVLSYIEHRGHVTYEELERFGDDVYQAVDRLLIAGKVHRSLGGILSERQRQQNKLNEWWEAKLEWKEFYRKRDEAKAFHRGPSDPDWEYVRDETNA